MSSSNVSSRPARTVYLQSPDDWEDWDIQFRSMTKGLDLWESIDPESDDYEPLLDKPAKPKAADHHNNAVRGQPVRIADLTPDGQKTYQLEWTVYQSLDKEYKSQKTSISNVKQWVSTTVSPEYFTGNCDPDESLRIWYELLKDHCSTDTVLDFDTARQNYRKAIVPLHKPPKDIIAWLRNWEQAMAQGITKEVPDALVTMSYFEDFLQAVQPLYQGWASAYRVSKRGDLAEGSLSYRVIANDFRKEVGSQGSHAAKIARGSFGPSFGPEKDVAGLAHPAESSSSSVGKAKGSTQGHKRVASEQAGLCPVCDLRHPLPACYYVFPEKAPEGFRVRDHVRKRADENLQKPEVASQVAKAKESAQRAKRKKVSFTQPTEIDSEQD